MKKQPQHWMPSFLPEEEKARLIKLGWREDPNVGWTNTRDPWWLTGWCYLAWFCGAILLFVGAISLIKHYCA